MQISLKNLLVVTAIVEIGTGLGLLLVPALLFAILLGIEQAAPEALFVGRIAGAGLLAIGVASWLAKNDVRTPAQLGLLVGVLTYDAAATLLLALAGTNWGMVGIGIWPAVALHATLTVWWLVCLLQPGGGRE